MNRENSRVQKNVTVHSLQSSKADVKYAATHSKR